MKKVMAGIWLSAVLALYLKYFIYAKAAATLGGGP